jgi:hypothetical protein
MTSLNHRSRSRAGRVPVAVSLTAALTVGSVAINTTPSWAGAGLGWINSVRAGSGKPALAGSGGLDGIASSHTQAMISQNTLFHSSGLGGKVGSSAASAHNALLNSATHKANILGAYNVAGSAEITAPDGRVWVTEVFAYVPGLGGAAPAPAAPKPAATAAPKPAPVARPATASTARATTARASRSAPRARVAQSVDDAATDNALAAPVEGGIITGLAAANDGGYWLVGDDGGVFAFGDAQFKGALAGQPLAAPVMGMAATPTRQGYWLVGADGGVFAFGDAVFQGGLAAKTLAAPIAGMAAAPKGGGYWLVGEDGGVFAFGDAGYFGGLAGQTLAAPVVGMAATPSGFGYWLVAADGGVFAFGDAVYRGGLAGQALAAPVVGITSSPSGLGYWLVGADGGVFALGDAVFQGAAGRLAQPAVAVAATPDGNGYWLAGSDAGVFSFGKAPFKGALADQPLAAPTFAPQAQEAQ